MDTITRRSAYLSTALHGCLVVVAFFPRGCSTTPPASAPPVALMAPAPQAPPTPPAHAAHPAATTPKVGRLVLAPLSVPEPPLPSLGGQEPALPVDPATLITPANTDRPGPTTGAGTQGTINAQVKPPVSAPLAQDLIAQLRGHATSNQELSREEKLLHTTQEFLEDLLNIQVRSAWRSISARVRQTRLIIEVSLDPSGVVHAHLANSSGDQEFDLAVEDWLHSPDLRLPPIKPDVRYPFLVMIRR